MGWDGMGSSVGGKLSQGRKGEIHGVQPYGAFGRPSASNACHAWLQSRFRI